MKKLLIVITALLLLACSVPGQESPPPEGIDLKTLNLATWNIRILSDGSRDDGELTLIASIIDDNDLVAIQEARDLNVLNRLEAMLPDFDFIASQPTGGGVKEIYAFFYKEHITPLGSHSLGDPDDLFIREPYIGYFRVHGYDFGLVSNHIIYGDSITQRRTEVALLDEVYDKVLEACSPEQDIVILGDFNLPADDDAWDLDVPPLIPETVKTTITDTSSFDNMWFMSDQFYNAVESVKVYRFDEKLFDNDDDAASLAVSDHRPVSALLAIPPDMDDEGDWFTISTMGDSVPGTSDDGDVRITHVVDSPTDLEEITITNHSAWNVDLTVWTLGDLNNPTAYNIPSGTLIEPGESISYPHSTLGFGINNSGEFIYLMRGEKIIDTWSN